MRHLILLVCIAHSLVGQDFALKQLEESPRHHEWVHIKNGDREVVTFVVYPEASIPSKSVILIHENRGLNDWARSAADQLAAKGYIVLAPDLLSGFSPEYEKTADFPNSDAARSAIYDLEKAQVVKDLDSVYAYAIENLESGNQEVSVMGFCWGGSTAFYYATQNENLEEALVFYGTAPDDQHLIDQINCPVYGFYGGDDNRVNATIERTEQEMKNAGNTYSYEIYPGAGHAFMRRGDDPNAAGPNKEARDKAWQRVAAIL